MLFHVGTILRIYKVETYITHSFLQHFLCTNWNRYTTAAQSLETYLYKQAALLVGKFGKWKGEFIDHTSKPCRPTLKY
jgi:hypothetical protein